MASAHNRILTTHVGSLVRPDDLVAFLRKQMNGEPYDQAAYDACLKTSVAEVVRKQAEVGIDIVSDGEYGKTMSWSRYVLRRLDGFVEESVDTAKPNASLAGKDRRDFADFYREYEETYGSAGLGKGWRTSSWKVTGPIKYSGQKLLQRDIDDLKEAVRGVDIVNAFLPVVAPASVAPNHKDEYYKTPEEALFAIADALHVEYKAIADSGLLVQIDDAFLASMYDVMVPPKSMEEYRRWAEIRVEALNHALKGIPQEKTRYHLCWGSWNGPHTTDVAIKDIVDLVLRINTGGYSLEMANPRHEHEWQVWEDVKLPEGKTLVPGLISHATNIVEHPELVAQRILRLTNLVGRDNVIASTDCGFAQGPFTRRVHPSIMWAKLAALAEGARIASRKLWPRAA